MNSNFFENKINKLFLDDNDNIYILDNNNIFYLYTDHQYYPFSSKLNNIRQCFMMNDMYVVHHDSTISLFDKNQIEIERRYNIWVTNDIDDVCYEFDLNLIITLEKGNIFINFNYDDIVNRTCLNMIYNDNYHHFHSYEHIKIINKLLLAYKNGTMDIFLLDHNKTKFYRSAGIDLHEFSKIIEYKSMLNCFISNDFSCYFLTDDQDIHQDLNNYMFPKIGYYFVNIDKSLYCYHKVSYYSTIIVPLLSIMPVMTKSMINLSHGNQLMVLTFKDDISFEIISHCDEKQILVYNNEYYLINNNYEKIIFDEILVNYDTINNFYTEKTDEEFVTDIQENKSVVDQLINIIPNIYRINNKFIYLFEQVNNTGKVVSYGDGVTRFVYNSLRKELDDILDKKFCDYNDETVIKLGKLLYFCNTDGFETFGNIHPYFFYCLSKKMDVNFLLKKFKSSEYNNFYKLYKEYSMNPQLLIDLDIGLNSADDYIKNIMISDLTDNEIYLYDKFVKGYMFFMKRSAIYEIIKNYSVSFYVNKLLFDGYFEVCPLFRMYNDNVCQHNFQIFCKIFEELFRELSKHEVSCFSQNITGSNYYVGDINILYAYEDNLNKSNNKHNDESHVEQNIEQNIEQTIEQNIEQNVSNNLSYQISTCNTELIVNIPATFDNVKQLINALTIEDYGLKN
ncbi:hypothetical protein QLL95_gp0896 [Cotonvirus japonicus]|uniref:Uncharacterized protein n=1 Tax=Cotonvirus japonicus TaxID=2811091 RepID=A0ABM7NT17_9VIRU|nr:hypothetical protein QLL95_gp0896 [Cotonvirus japonicus]BCS83227.1 hypothetical protein [Cotonvirus japonicus]